VLVTAPVYISPAASRDRWFAWQRAVFAVSETSMNRGTNNGREYYHNRHDNH
jgi:hypothetical protein